MPKRLMIVLCVAALAVAACHSSSSTTPTPSFSPGSPAPNPSITDCARLSHDQWRAQIEDSGPGIDAKVDVKPSSRETL